MSPHVRQDSLAHQQPHLLSQLLSQALISTHGPLLSARIDYEPAFLSSAVPFISSSGNPSRHVPSPRAATSSSKVPVFTRGGVILSTAPSFIPSMSGITRGTVHGGSTPNEKALFGEAEGTLTSQQILNRPVLRVLTEHPHHIVLNVMAIANGLSKGTRLDAAKEMMSIFACQQRIVHQFINIPYHSIFSVSKLILHSLSEVFCTASSFPSASFNPSAHPSRLRLLPLPSHPHPLSSVDIPF